MLIRSGNMVKMKDVHGFGFVKEIIWCPASKNCVMLVSVYFRDSLKEAQDLPFDANHVSLFHSEPCNAKRIYADPDDHKHAALMMQDDGLV